MRNLAKLSWVALCLAVAGWAQIQTPPPPGSAAKTNDHGNIGAFVNYTRLEDLNLDLLGAGGRIGFMVHKPVMLEAEMAYDFQRTRTQVITVGGITNTVRTDIRLLHALFGPKIETKKGPLRLFVVAKAGIVNFGVGGPATAGAVNNQIGTIVNGDTNLAAYPGVGFEFNIKRIGFRAEAGDEIIFLRGNTINHNIRASFGPQLRF